jgi:hypothetical protein
MTTLVIYDAACRTLAEARRVDEVKDIRDKAVAMAIYARQAKNRDLEADAIEIRMRATRKLDQLRQAQKETVGLHKGGGDQRSDHRGSKNPGDRPTLASQGIDKNLAKQARALGALSPERFEQVLADARDATTRAYRNVVNAAIIEQEREGYRVRSKARRSRISKRWSALVRDLASSTRKTCGLLWVKLNPNGEGLFTGMGYHTRANTEPCLLATRGSPRRLASAVHQVVMAPVGEHSKKPEEVARRIERLYSGPYLELFARGEARPGWAVWGNEAHQAKILAPAQPVEPRQDSRVDCRADPGPIPDFLDRNKSRGA